MDRQVKYMNAIRRVKMAGQSQRELLKLAYLRHENGICAWNAMLCYAMGK